MKLKYPVILEQEPDGSAWNVKFTDFEEAFTYGVTREEALFNAVEVLDLTIESRIEDNEDIPLPTVAEEADEYIAPSSTVQSALLVRIFREEGGKSMADLARGLGTSWPAAARLEDHKHWPSLKQLDKAATVLGKRLVISFE